MYAKLSNTLQSLLARTAFDAAKHHPTTDPATLLAIALLEQEAIAREILWEMLGQEQARHRIAQLQQLTNRAQNAPCEEFFLSLPDRLRRRFYDEPMITTAHLLILLLEEPDTACAPLFFQVGITPSSLYEEVLNYNEEGQEPKFIAVKEGLRPIATEFKVLPSKGLIDLASIR